MNYRLVCRLLSIVCLIIGVTMIFSLPWAWPVIGHRTDEDFQKFELHGFLGLIYSILFSIICWAVLWRIGRTAKGELYRREAMAVVGLSWLVATVLGAMPFLLSGSCNKLAVRLFESSEHAPQVYGDEVSPLSLDQYALVHSLVQAGARGLPGIKLAEQYEAKVRVLSKGEPPQRPYDEVLSELRELPHWRGALLEPGEEPDAPLGRRDNFRVRAVPMNIADALFESQSGFSTTGATVIADLEDPVSLPHCILFWRSSTHFLGGLGIIVLFVVILGQGSAGKALMRNEMPGPSKEGSHSRMQHTAWMFAGLYCGLNLVLTVLLWLLGMNFFDAVCHAFGTLATGGFSTYNSSLGHFVQADPVSGAWIEYVVIVFMTLAGTNFTLLYFMMFGQASRLFKDIEWRYYIGIIVVVTAAVMTFGMVYDDFVIDPETSVFNEFLYALRYGLFQVVSIITTTGYGTHDFDQWNSFGRGVLFLLMFVGGCAGSTGGGLKVIRHILFHKILFLQLEKSYHPTVVRPLRLGGRPVDDPDLQTNILIYFSLILVLFVFGWLAIVTLEPDSTWGASEEHIEHKLIDSATAVAATLNNVGPGLGIIGATQNYAYFTWWTKLLFTALMMIGRLEIFAVLVLFIPRFWRSR
ncbi:TrkH family potassium uptake protein [Bremerella sp. T1]|uniref:TrkH family potassium uptake protein n=1 Tax=Bremerella sp. TYQ1 TaxID=3119568 RepID=UPI001CCEABCD|nr:TrkH family potassium uptake protein [Bremerella volcania]UBM35495.1 TrkH family potassium uptake protein [Bremerella volcania]